MSEYSERDRSARWCFWSVEVVKHIRRFWRSSQIALKIYYTTFALRCVGPHLHMQNIIQSKSRHELFLLVREPQNRKF
jgi:hypothetical protein